LFLCREELGAWGKISKIITAMARAITPPNLFGIERRIAYANKKYHSGWICTGVTKGLAGIKFSGSPSSQGHKNTKVPRSQIAKINPNKSLEEKYG
jgi:hypothetical protein